MLYLFGSEVAFHKKKKKKKKYIFGGAIAQCMLHRKQKSLKEMSLIQYK